MHRRTVLSGGFAALAGLAGCAGRNAPGEDTPESLPTVKVVASHYGAYSPVASDTLRVTRGELTRRIEHRDDEKTPDVAARNLSADEYEATQRLVTDIDPETWRDEYPCRDVCATDDGNESIAVTVDGTTHETVIDPEAAVPDRIDRFQSHLEDYWNRFEGESR